MYLIIGIYGRENTIQAEIEKAISTLIFGKKANFKSRQIKTVFSGRTDKGVNAKGQIIHFYIDKDIVASEFINSMNGLLPNDISVSELLEIDEGFHAQKSAVKRYYEYKLINRTQRTAFDGDLTLVRYDLNIERINKSLSYLLGRHDFTSFRNLGSQTPCTDCFLYKAECEKLGDTVIFNIVGNRFLYNMVRIIVGTLLMIEKDNLEPEEMQRILEAKDRSKAGQTVSPYGLTLMKVEYS
jgi:tRNA pseudouridine38-40 synthase